MPEVHKALPQVLAILDSLSSLYFPASPSHEGHTRQVSASGAVYMALCLFLIQCADVLPEGSANRCYCLLSSLLYLGRRDVLCCTSDVSKCEVENGDDPSCVYSCAQPEG